MIEILNMVEMTDTLNLKLHSTNIPIPTSQKYR